MQLFLKKSGKKVSIYQQMGYEYQLFSLLNFPGAAIFNFYDVICDCCTQNNVFFFQPYCVKKIQNSYSIFSCIEIFLPLLGKIISQYSAAI